MNKEEKRDELLDDILEIQRWRDAAMSGNADIQYRLWLLYKKGHEVVSQSFEEAVYWLKMAASYGHAKANFQLGALYLDRDETWDSRQYIPHDVQKSNDCFQVALRAFERQASEGDDEAYLWLAAMYNGGFGVPKDDVKREQLLECAAKLGNKIAENTLNGVVAERKQTPLSSLLS